MSPAYREVDLLGTAGSQAAIHTATDTMQSSLFNVTRQLFTARGVQHF